jgi:lipopolysaccharide O-acetyltransferase
MTAARRTLGRLVVAGARQGRRLYGKAFSLSAAGAFASFGPRSVLEPPVRLKGERRIAIGSGVWIGGGSWLNVLEPDGDGVAIEIGDGCRLAGGCTLAAARSVRLGRSVLFARGVYVADHGHAFDDTGRPVLAQGVTAPAPVDIDDGAWLGEHVVVCPGVRIGRGAVIGANAVVTADVPDHAVAVGAPARVVRRLDGPARAAERAA